MILKKTENLAPPIRFSYLKLGKIFVSRWHWLLVVVAISLLAGKAFIYYCQPVFTASASFKIEEKRSELSELINVRNFYDRTNTSESAAFIIRSRNVLLKARQALNNKIYFFTPSRFSHKNIFPQKPLIIKIIRIIPGKGQDFEFEAINAESYQLTYNQNGERHQNKYSYGQLISTKTCDFRIEKKNIPIKPGTHYFFYFEDEETFLQNTRRNLSIDETKNSSAIQLKLSDSNPYFAKAILDAILDQYIAFDQQQRSSAISQTENFIDTLVSDLSITLTNSGKHLEHFKRTNPLLDFSTGFSQSLNDLTQLESQIQALDIRNLTIKSFQEHLRSATASEEISYGPQNSDDPQLFSMIDRYNELIVNKNLQLKIFTASSPVVKKTEEELNALKIALNGYMSSRVKTNQAIHRLFEGYKGNIHNFRAKMPAAERHFTHLQTKYEINKKVHDYLSEKKLEAQIAKASITPAISVIDRPYLPEQPVFPIARNVYTLSLLSGLTIFTAAIVLRRALNPFIYGKESVEMLTGIPIIGVVRNYHSTKKDHKIPVLNDLRSGFTESLRAVRTNLRFLAPEKETKIICITSEVSGEGKSFLALNIAAALTLIEKKVLLVAADLRRSQLHETFEINNSNGLSNYLCRQQQLHQIIKKTTLPNLDFIPSGPIPPNPSELLQSPLMNTLFETLRTSYDFIIADSAPVGLVTDGKALLNLSDINLFVMRCGVSKQIFTKSPELLQQEFNLSNFAIVLNDFKNNRFYDGLYHYPQSNHAYHYPGQIHSSYHKTYFES